MNDNISIGKTTINGEKECVTVTINTNKLYIRVRVDLTQFMLAIFGRAEVSIEVVKYRSKV